jgi:hypothetical protein
MGFNKRFLKKEGILSNLENIMEYLDVDAAYLTDKFSIEIYRMFNSGKSKEEIINRINEIKDDSDF